MENVTDISEQAKKNANEASAPGKFNFLDRLVGRNYPTEDVVVYIDEASAMELSRVEEQLVSTPADEKKKLAELEAKAQDLYAKLDASKFVFHLEGISTEEYDKVVDEGLEEYPLEYSESRHPLTFALERTPIPSEERDERFRTHMWAKVVRSVTSPSGEVDDNITPEWIARVSGLLPIMGSIRISEAVDRLRMVTGWMDNIQDENFFSKS